MSRWMARKESGATAVEFALVVTPLLMIVFGIIQYAFYFWAMQGGADVARQAARLGAVGNPAACPAFRDAVRASLGAVATAPLTATATRTYSNGPGNTAAAVEIGDNVTITVRFKSADFNLPFVPFINDGWVEDTVMARVDYVPDSTIVACS